MKKNQLETIFYSTLGVAALLLLLIAFNFIAGRAKQRLDLTAEKSFTLSDGTKAILKGLDTKVKIRFYCTQRDNTMPVVLKTYAQRVEDLLGEYKQAAHGNIVIEKYSPEPDSDAEDSANLDGVEGQMLQSGEKIYLGLAISLLDEKSTIPFLSPDRERLLEYDLSRAISRVTKPEKPVVGVMTPLSVFGQQANPMMRRMGQQPQGEEAWTTINELKNDFTVNPVEMTATKIDDDIKVLVVIHPKEITDAAQYAIDQFVLRGGKLIAFVDPNCFVDNRGQNPMMGSGPSSSSLDKLFKAWGVEFDQSKVVADMTFASQTSQGPTATVLSVGAEGANHDDVLTSQIDAMLLPFPGAFTISSSSGLKSTVLLQTSKDSQLVDGFMAQIGGEQITKDFKSGDKQMPLAVRLTGKFKTAFPDGKPKEKTDDKEADKTPAKTEAGLKESAGENSVILVADVDMLHDIASVEKQNFFGQTIVIPRGQNLSFVQGSVEQMAGDSNLITVRSRATMNRPFTLVKKMEAKAQETFRARIKELESNLADTQRKLGELQQNKDKGQKFIMSPEQQKEIENFRKTEAETNKELKKVRKDLRREIDSLEARLKWLNILGMPVVVAISGIGLAVLKRQRTAAK